MSRSSPTTATGRLIVLPTPLDFGCTPLAPIEQMLPHATLQAATQITHFITENAKSTRAFLKRVEAIYPLTMPLQQIGIAELPHTLHKKGDHDAASQAAHSAAVKDLLAPALAGQDIALVSEAGIPAVADPGASVVRMAHQLGIDVVVQQGSSSLMLALAGSGLGGQHFAFVGYLPQDAKARMDRIKALDASSHKLQQTQICIETPYRNAALLAALLHNLRPTTRLAVALGLGLPEATLKSQTVALWRQKPTELPLHLPAVWMWGA